LSTGEAAVSVVGQFVGGQRERLTAVSHFTGDEQTDDPDQLELRRSESTTELN